jgi:hypothetical protein
MPALTTFTVEGWVKRTVSTGRYETFFSNADSYYGQVTFGVYVDGGNVDCGSSPPNQFAWAYTKVGTGWMAQCSGVTASLGVWYHIAATRDSSGTARIFVNGVLRGTLTGTAAPTSSSGAFGIGEAGDALTEFFGGNLAEIRISSIARYAASFTPQTANFSTDANTVALYHLDEGTGTVLNDASGNNRNGIFGASPPLWSSDVPY